MYSKDVGNLWKNLSTTMLWKKTTYAFASYFLSFLIFVNNSSIPIKSSKKFVHCNIKTPTWFNILFVVFLFLCIIIAILSFFDFLSHDFFFPLFYVTKTRIFLNIYLKRPNINSKKEVRIIEEKLRMNYEWDKHSWSNFHIGLFLFFISTFFLLPFLKRNNSTIFKLFYPSTVLYLVGYCLHRGDYHLTNFNPINFTLIIKFFS